MSWPNLFSRGRKEPPSASDTELTPEARAVGMDYLRNRAGLPPVPPPEPRQTLPDPVDLPPPDDLPSPSARPDPPTEAAQTALEQPVENPPAAPAAGASPPTKQSISFHELVEQANEASAKNDWERVVHLWRAGRHAAPHIPMSYLGEARGLHRLNRNDEARALLAEAAKRFPDQQSIPIDQARLAMVGGDWSAAEAHWQRALAYNAKPWWIYGSLADCLIQQGRLADAEGVLLDARANADQRTEPVLFVNPARLAERRGDWVTAVVRWCEARQQFPDGSDVQRGLYLALIRVLETDPPAYDALLRGENFSFGEDQLRALLLGFESLGGSGAGDGCEFGRLQRSHGAEPVGLLRWATLHVDQLIQALNNRFAGLDDPATLSVEPHDGQWDVGDSVYGVRIQSGFLVAGIPQEHAVQAVLPHLSFLRQKLITDLQAGNRVFVLKCAGGISRDDIDRLSQSLRDYGSPVILCVCPATAENPEGSILRVAPGVLLGFIDFMSRGAEADRADAWIALCQQITGNASP